MGSGNAAQTAVTAVKGPDDYWKSPKFVRRYVINNINLIRENEAAALYNVTAMMGILQGIQYLCQEPRAVLDAGCGHATRALDIKSKLGCRVVGVDYSDPMLDEARRIMQMLPEDRRVEIYKGDSRSLSFKDEEFDVAVTYGLFMCMNDAPKAAAELMRVARYGVVSIEESEDAMTDSQREWAEKNVRAQNPGRNYWWNYNRMFAAAGANTVVFSPLPVPANWSMGAAPGYGRYIAVKEQNVANA